MGTVAETREPSFMLSRKLISRAACVSYCVGLIFLAGFLAGGEYRDLKRREQITAGTDIYLKFSKANAAFYRCKPVEVVTANGQYPISQ